MINWKPSSSSNLSIRAFRADPLILELDERFAVERFEATVSQSTVSSPTLIVSPTQEGKVERGV